MTEFKVGQRVRVEFDGYLAQGEPFEGRFAVFDRPGQFTYVLAESVTPADPENWPPQVGDIWEAEGSEYFVYVNRGWCSFIVFPFEGDKVLDSYDSGPDLEKFKALNPRLVRRR